MDMPGLKFKTQIAGVISKATGKNVPVAFANKAAVVADRVVEALKRPVIYIEETRS